MTTKLERIHAALGPLLADPAFRQRPELTIGVDPESFRDLLAEGLILAKRHGGLIFRGQLRSSTRPAFTYRDLRFVAVEPADQIQGHGITSVWFNECDQLETTAADDRREEDNDA